MKALIEYLDYINMTRATLGLSPFDLYDDFLEVEERLQDLGDPEILSGDGDLTRAQIQERTDKWINAMLELGEIREDLAA